MRKTNVHGVFIVSLMGLLFSSLANDSLKSGSYTVEQSWSQEKAI